MNIEIIEKYELSAFEPQQQEQSTEIAIMNIESDKNSIKYSNTTLPLLGIVPLFIYLNKIAIPLPPRYETISGTT